MPPGRGSRYDDSPQPRCSATRRPRSRNRGLGAGAWAAIIGGAAFCVALTIVGVVIARKGGLGGKPDDSLFSEAIIGSSPNTPPISKEDFQKIAATDTLATLESRFGRGTRMSHADMEQIVFAWRDRDMPRLKLKRTLTEMLEAQYGLRNPECYRWVSQDTTVYVVMKPGEQSPAVKIYMYQHTDENGHFRGETVFDNFIPVIGF